MKAEMVIKSCRWLALIVIVSGTALGQTNSAATAVPSPHQIRTTFLKSGSELSEIDAKEKLATMLRLVTAPATATQHEATCTQFESMVLNYPTLETGHRDAVFVLRSDKCWFDFVVILRQRPSGVWNHIATYPVFSKYDHSGISFPSLLKKGQNEILIHRTNIISGVGFWQYNTTVVRVHEGKAEVVLDESQESNLSVPDNKGSNTELLETGTFFVVPAEEPENALCDILEKQVISKHQQKIGRWRIFSWDPKMNRFRPQLVEESYAVKLSAKAILKSSSPR